MNRVKTLFTVFSSLYTACMKILLRSVLSLAFIVWIGAEIFFPFVAATVFRTLSPDTHTAGSIVGSLLRTLHWMGLVCGILALASLTFAPALGMARPRLAVAAACLVVLMMAATAYSQFVITPSMERDRVAAGGAINKVAETHPARAHFNRLHKQSERMEQCVLFLGLAAIVVLACAETR